jgi:predicted AAA+ superfamily ATPase
MIERTRETETVLSLLRRHPVVGLVGARQVGKTTLAGMVQRRFGGPSVRFDLEDPEDLARLSDPAIALKDRRGLVVIDEVQRAPNLFPLLRVLADRPGKPARFLVLGSASPALLRQTAETLAGRILYYELGGLWMEEVGAAHRDRLWTRGGFPRSYLARTHADSFEWRRGFVKTFLERDLPQLGIGISSTTLHRFWTMLAHWHGQVWNASEFGRSFGVADTTVRKYLDTLASAMVVRLLMPWRENLSKRQVKSPKVCIRDTGLLHALLGLRSQSDLEGHPKVGASWEGFALEQVLRRTGALPEECFFWGTHGGAELDLLIVRGRKRIGFEFKRTVAPSVTTSMRVALADLRLDRLNVVHGGEGVFPLGDRIRAVALDRITEDVDRMG